ncbi:hypothetical protein SEA_DIZZYRUDY_56 [Microbacterium phage DizzyRudy]|nr:hypothetical protein SEA_DIZZYRUDY_56 [Microbacterium phage DizzyRudy]WMI34490.1 hypothetical protein SEA_DAMASCUS_53 [Microbacterium phage Damascus]
MAEDQHEEPPAVVNESEAVYLYRYDPVTNLPVVVGKIFIDENRDAWVRLNATDLAEGIGVEDIDGVALLNRDQFNHMEPE